MNPTRCCHRRSKGPAYPVPGKRVTALAIALFATTLSGCLDDILLSDDSPGVYKGRQDPLLSQSVEQRDAALQERLQLIQNRQ